MISRRPERVGYVEVDRAVEAPGTQQRRVEVGGAVGRTDHEDVRERRGLLLQAPVRRQPAVGEVDEARLHAAAARRLIERLQLDQELVHDTRDAFARGAALDVGRPVQELVERRAPHAAARAGDRVDLFDESDRAALFARGLAQLLEVVADLAAGLAVVHRLERGGRHEQVGHARFPGHRLRHVGLAGAGRPFEQDRLTRVAPHVLAERLVPEEEVERVHDLLADGPDADDVVHRDVDLARVVTDVRRLPGRHHRHDRSPHRAARSDRAEGRSPSGPATGSGNRGGSDWNVRCGSRCTG